MRWTCQSDGKGQLTRSKARSHCAGKMFPGIFQHLLAMRWENPLHAELLPVTIRVSSDNHSVLASCKTSYKTCFGRRHRSRTGGWTDDSDIIISNLIYHHSLDSQAQLMGQRSPGWENECKPAIIMLWKIPTLLEVETDARQCFHCLWPESKKRI